MSTVPRGFRFLALLASFFSGAAVAAQDDEVHYRPDWSDPAVKADAQLDLIQGFLDADRPAEALVLVQTLREQGLDGPGLDFAQARALVALGQPDKAVVALERLLRWHRRSAQGWALLGLAEADRENLDESVAALKRAARLDSENADVLNNLGYAELATGDVSAAVRHLRTAVELDPTLLRARNNLGFALAESGEDTAALRAFRAAGTEADARFNMGVACERRADLPGALNNYQAALAADAGHAKASSAVNRLLSSGSFRSPTPPLSLESPSLESLP